MVQGIKTVSFEEAVKVVKSGDRIHIHSVACAPQGFDPGFVCPRTCRRAEKH